MSSVLFGGKQAAGSLGLYILTWAVCLACSGGRPSVAASGTDVNEAVVLVALDGFHPSYLERAPSLHLRRLAQGGVRARWLVPVFPTLTFPNLYSIATGLYPEHHGIVSNTMKDSILGKFTLRDRNAVRDPRWWGGEPIWVTTVRQGKRAATFFWPGSDAPIGGVRPTHYKLFDPSVPNADRVRQVLEWLSLPSDKAPALVTLYLGDIDQAGHEFGPNSAETDSAIARVDSAVGALMSGLEERGLNTRVNLVVVSDHGMAAVKRGQLIYLDDFIDTASVDVVEIGPVLSLSPRPGAGEDVYRRLSGAHPHLKVYRKSEVPKRYHYRVHGRIPPIIGVADEGWIVTTRGHVASRDRQPLARGAHGYPPEVASMRGIFLARGPAFGKGVVVDPFQNIHIYALLAHVLRLRPAQNDGALDSVRAVLRPAECLPSRSSYPDEQHTVCSKV
jgi:predicted AlkP superfamily pyrophosphatase or phosphodiesterase